MKIVKYEIMIEGQKCIRSRGFKKESEYNTWMKKYKNMVKILEA